MEINREDPSRRQKAADTRVLWRERLGGLAHEYASHQAARADDYQARRPDQDDDAALPRRGGPAGYTLGIGKLAAAAVICEIGADVTAYFPDIVRVASWAGICLGHYESVGKQASGRRRHGNQDFEPVLAEAAWERPGRGVAQIPRPPAIDDIRRPPQDCGQEPSHHRRDPCHLGHYPVCPGHRNPYHELDVGYFDRRWTPNEKPAV